MRVRLLSAIALGLAIGAAAVAQDALPGQDAGMGGRGQRGGRGMGGGYGMGGGQRVVGTVTGVAADHYTVKTETGEIYTIHFSVNTRILKQVAGTGGGQGGGQGTGRGMRGGGMGMGGAMGMGGGSGNPPTPIKATDIKVGDAVGAMGEVDETSKSVGAVAIVMIDPERAKEMREMAANYGRTWLAGKVTAIDGVKVSLMGQIDNASHSFVADENTIFRKRRDPITLADIQVGDMVRVEGAVKDGVFLASGVMAMGMPAGGTPSVPRNAPPQ